jgi:hypothetical protein
MQSRQRGGGAAGGGGAGACSGGVRCCGGGARNTVIQTVVDHRLVDPLPKSVSTEIQYYTVVEGT